MKTSLKIISLWRTAKRFITTYCYLSDLLTCLGLIRTLLLIRKKSKNYWISVGWALKFLTNHCIFQVLYFSQIHGSQSSVPVEIEFFLTSSLTMAQSGVLLSVSVNELYLKPRAIIFEHFRCGQVDICGKIHFSCGFFTVFVEYH